MCSGLTRIITYFPEAPNLLKSSEENFFISETPRVSWLIVIESLAHRSPIHQQTKITSSPPVNARFQSIVIFSFFFTTLFLFPFIGKETILCQSIKLSRLWTIIASYTRLISYCTNQPSSCIQRFIEKFRRPNNIPTTWNFLACFAFSWHLESASKGDSYRPKLETVFPLSIIEPHPAMSSTLPLWREADERIFTKFNRPRLTSATKFRKLLWNGRHVEPSHRISEEDRQLQPKLPGPWQHDAWSPSSKLKPRKKANIGER